MNNCLSETYKFTFQNMGYAFSEGNAQKQKVIISKIDNIAIEEISLILTEFL